MANRASSTWIHVHMREYARMKRIKTSAHMPLRMYNLRVLVGTPNHAHARLAPLKAQLAGKRAALFAQDRDWLRWVRLHVCTKRGVSKSEHAPCLHMLVRTTNGIRDVPRRRNDPLVATCGERGSTVPPAVLACALACVSACA